MLFLSLVVDDKPGMDEVTLLATVTMFLVWGPEEIAQTQAIQIQCVTVFRDCWESNIQEVCLSDCTMQFLNNRVLRDWNTG